MRYRRLRPWVLGGGICLVAMGGLLILAGSWLQYPPSAPSTAGAIVVLGGDYPARVLTGIDLYKRDLAPQLWITGDVPRSGDQRSTASFASRVAENYGIARTQQRLLATRNTWEDAEMTRHLAIQQGVQRVMIVTSWYHSRRAMCVFTHVMASAQVQVSYIPAAATIPSPESWWRDLSGWYFVAYELVACSYYWLRYQVSPWSC